MNTKKESCRSEGLICFLFTKQKKKGIRKRGKEKNRKKKFYYELCFLFFPFFFSFFLFFPPPFFFSDFSQNLTVQPTSFFSLPSVFFVFSQVLLFAVQFVD